MASLAGQQASVGAGGVLPTLTGGTAAADPTAGQTQQAGAPGAEAPASPIPDFGSMLAKTPAWMGPAAVIGGAALAIYGFTKPSMMFKMMGISMGLSGLAMTHMGASARGREGGIKELEAAITPVIQQQSQLVEQQGAQIKQYEQVFQQLKASGAMPQAGTDAGTGTGGTPGTTTPGTTTPGTTDQTTTPGTGGTPGDGTAQGTTPGQALGPGQWSPSALAEQAIQLGAAKLSGGAAVADAGSFVLKTPVGEPAGYATFDEASTAVQSTMSTDIFGTKNHRWVVLEHEGRYFAIDAELDEAGTAAAMPAGNGNIVGWHALRYDENQHAWMSYHWSLASGSSFTPFTNGSIQTAGSVGGTAGTGTTAAATPAATGGTTAGTVATTATPDTISVSAGGGTAATPAVVTPVAAAPAAPVRPAVEKLVGSGFSINDSSVDGKTAKGGWLQLQKLARLSEAGFATPGEAGALARQERSASLNLGEWTRWVTVRGEDGRFYVFEGQVVSKATTAMSAGTSPMHVFGHGFAEFFDGAAWKVQAD